MGIFHRQKHKTKITSIDQISKKCTCAQECFCICFCTIDDKSFNTFSFTTHSPQQRQTALGVRCLRTYCSLNTQTCCLLPNETQVSLGCCLTVSSAAPLAHTCLHHHRRLAFSSPHTLCCIRCSPPRCTLVTHTPPLPPPYKHKHSCQEQSGSRSSRRSGHSHPRTARQGHPTGCAGSTGKAATRGGSSSSCSCCS